MINNIDKLRELYKNWLKDVKWRKEAGDPLYVYEVYEFLDYCEDNWEEVKEKEGNDDRN